MPVLGKKTLQDIHRWLFDHAAPQRLLDATSKALWPKRSVTLARKRVRAKNTTRRERISTLRDFVANRAGDECECGCGRHFTEAGPAHMDHFYSGANKRAMEDHEGCWLITKACHDAKHRASPSRRFWLQRYLEHCNKWGYRGPAVVRAGQEALNMDLMAQSQSHPSQETKP